MKKLLSVLLGLALCLGLMPGAAGAEDALRGYDPENGYVYVTLGQYPQTAEGEVRPILWRVLSVEDGHAYLLSEYILFARCMNASLKAYRDELKGDFGQTELCQYLNTTFAAEAFPGGELAMLEEMSGVGKIFPGFFLNQIKNVFAFVFCFFRTAASRLICLFLFDALLFELLQLF